MKYLKQLTICMLIAGLFFVSSNAWSKKTETAEKNVPQIISSPTIPYPEGVDPADFSEQFDVQEYEQDELNLNNVYVVCGDSVVDESEECDDGDRTMGDGCSDVCLLENPLACGNRQVDPGESCDDGNKSGNDGCSPSCQLESIFGNGKAEGGEDCDDGNQKAGDGCSVKCTKENKEENCRTATGKKTRDCDELTDNALSFCGNGVINDGEECDDKNQNSGDGCSSVCKREADVGFCGDGILNKNEGCDDGNRRNGDGCSSACLVEEKVNDFDPPICNVDVTKQTVEYKPGRAKVSPSSCSGTCTMKVTKNNCGKEIGDPTWITKEDKILQGTYTGSNGAEISCQTGQAARNESIRFLEIGNSDQQKAVVIDCEL